MADGLETVRGDDPPPIMCDLFWERLWDQPLWTAVEGYGYPLEIRGSRGWGLESRRAS